MNNNDLNQTIASYANSCNYEGAIMLTAEWGAGKSYYLRSELIPFLEKNGIKVLVVSLHGLNDEFEISKAIYVEFLLSKDKTKKIREYCVESATGKEMATHAKYAAKTLIRGITSFFNIDLSHSEEELKELYNSIDLSDTLVVFEDVERSNLDSKDIMAYVNNMTEYDGVKVLLVTNEKEFNKSDNNSKYKEIKEKTIGDTLKFEGDQIKAIENMSFLFSNEIIGPFLKKAIESTNLINEIIAEIKEPTLNLRSIKFGIEKFNEMMTMVHESIDFEFEKDLFISFLSFVHKYRKDNTIEWEEKEDFSTKLSSFAHPLFKFAYDYIVNNYLDKKALLQKEKEYKEYQSINKAKGELSEKLSPLYNCYVEKEETVKEAILFIKDSLKQNNIVPYDLYFKIANYLIYVKHIIRFDGPINECLKTMLNNLSSLKKEQFEKINYFGGIALTNEDSIEEYNQFKEKAGAIVKKNKMNPLDFSYETEDVDSFCEMANDSKDSYYTSRAFAANLNISKLLKLTKKLSSLQLNELRGVFINIYSVSNINEFFADDRDNLNELLKGLESLKKYRGFDSIQKQQILYFINNLQEIIARLERGY